MNFTAIGHQLRAYRLGSGLRAEAIAARLGVSRAALYRYEKGDVIKLDTVIRLAELLGIPLLTLLGITLEYYTSAVTFHERLREIEETADQIIVVGGATCYLTTSDEFETAILLGTGDDYAATGDRMSAKAAATQIVNIIAARKRAFRDRRPNMIAILDPCAIERELLANGSLHAIPPARRVVLRQRIVAELERVAAEMEDEQQIGRQIGLLAQPPNGTFIFVRSRERRTVAVDPFRAGGLGGGEPGVSVVMTADDACSAYQAAAERHWQRAVKGAPAAARIRALIRATEPGRLRGAEATAG